MAKYWYFYNLKLAFEYMKKVFMILILLSFGNIISAESFNGQEHNDIGVVAGFNFPMYKDAGEGVVVGLTYSNWSSRGLEFKTGFQYISRTAYVDNTLGVPFWVAFRTKEKDTLNRFSDGAYSAAKSSTRFDDNSENLRYVILSFLVGLFSNAEFYAGLTPGYVIGNDSPTRSSIWTSNGRTHWENSWTEVKNRFSATLDAGMNLNYRIWRFNLKIMPTFHYNVLDNFVIHKSQGCSNEGETLRTTQHVRWLFSISGGLTFNF